MGTIRPREEAAISLTHAFAVHRLVLDGVLPHAPLVAADDHLPDLVLHADPRLLSDLADRMLASLRRLPPPRRSPRRVAAESAAGRAA